MIMPVQRVPRYVLLLQELIKNSSELHSQWDTMQTALKKLKEIAMAINEGQRSMENTMRLNELSNLLRKVPKDFQLVKPHRKLIKEGTMIVVETGTKKSYDDSDKLHVVYLFNDILLMTGTENQWRHVIDLAAAKVSQGGEPLTFEVNTHSFHVVFKLADEKQLQDWQMSIIQEIEKRKASRATKRVLGARGNKELLSKKGSVHNHISDRLHQLDQGGEVEGRESRANTDASSRESGREVRGTTMLERRKTRKSNATGEEKHGEDAVDEEDEGDDEESEPEELLG